MSEQMHLPLEPVWSENLKQIKQLTAQLEHVIDNDSAAALVIAKQMIGHSWALYGFSCEIHLQKLNTKQ